MFLFLCLTVVLCLALVAYFLSPDRRMWKYGQMIPGRKPWPLIGNMFDIDVGHKGVESFCKDQKQYGYVVRKWLGKRLAVLLSDPDDAEILFRDTQNLGKAFIYRFLHPWLGTGLLTSKGHKWHMRRKAITPTFHFKILDQFVEVFERKSQTLIECLKSKADGRSFNIEPYVSRFSLDVICETAMGISVEAQVNLESKYVNAVRNVADVIVHRITKFWQHPDIIYNLTKEGRQQKAALDIIHGFSKKVIKEQERLLKTEEINNEENDTGIKKKTAFLRLLLEMKKQQNPAFATEEDIREEMDTFMFEGYDTTASAINFAIYELGMHPDIQEKAYQEVKEVLACDRPLTIENLNNLKYLDMVIKEVLRIHPPVPIIGREVCKDIKLPSGYLVPAGSIAIVVIGGLHRNEKHYKNPENFDPDRFLPEVIAKRHPYSYVPFSAGPRNCVGQKFAMLELKASLSHILLNYEIGTTEMCLVEALLTLQSKNGHNVWLKPRHA